MPTKTIWERLDGKIEEYPTGREVRGDCWIWLGCVDQDGYGRIKWQGKNRQAHRVIYEALIGEIGKDEDGNKLELDHLCERRQCCNPEHMEPVTHTENNLRIYDRSRRVKAS